MTPFTGYVWRIMDAAFADDPTSCVYGNEGRFHHSGQPAIYTSLTQEGAAIAIRRYVGTEDPARVIVKLLVSACAVVDLRTASEYIDDPQKASRVWHDVRATGKPAPTWVYSDAARKKEAEGILYLSRSQPVLSHLVVFNPEILTATGSVERWHAPY